MDPVLHSKCNSNLWLRNSFTGDFKLRIHLFINETAPNPPSRPQKLNLSASEYKILEVLNTHNKGLIWSGVPALIANTRLPTKHWQYTYWIPPASNGKSAAQCLQKRTIFCLPERIQWVWGFVRIYKKDSTASARRVVKANQITFFHPLWRENHLRQNRWKLWTWVCISWEPPGEQRRGRWRRSKRHGAHLRRWVKKNVWLSEYSTDVVSTGNPGASAVSHRAVTDGIKRSTGACIQYRQKETP